MTGKIIKGIAGFYYIHNGQDKVYACKAKGIFRNRGIKPVVGDNVKFTVLDALQLGYKVNVITDGCRGVNIQPQDSAHAFMEMSAAGATLYTLADWEETQG